MLSKIFLLVPKTALFIVAITAFTASICNIYFQAAMELWMVGGIVTTLSLLASGWVICSLLIRHLIKKGWGVQRVSLLKLSSFLVLLLMGFSLTSQLVFADEDDDEHTRKAAVAAGVAVVAGGAAALASAPVVVIGGTVIMVAAGVYSAYHAYQSAADCECSNCTSPCSCSYPQCSNNDSGSCSGSCGGGGGWDGSGYPPPGYVTYDSLGRPTYH